MKIDTLKALEAAATTGPWVVEDTDDGFRYVNAKPHPGSYSTGICSNVDYYPTSVGVEDQALIAAARNALPALLRVAEAAKRLRGMKDDTGNADAEFDAMEALDAALAELESA